MSISVARKIFIICNSVMNYKFTLLGVETSLYGLLLFSLLVGIVLYYILYFFHHE